MKHLDFLPTPVSSLKYYSDKFSCNIKAKRDDLFTEACGGNKARMLQYILADVNKDTCDVVITAGGPCSNFNRACALMCAKQGVKMHLVEYTDKLDEFDTSLNYFLCNLVGITKTRCLKSRVPETIKNVVESYKGQRVKLIYGGGKSAQVRKSVDSPPGMLTEDHHHTVHEERQVCYSSHLRPKSLHL